MGLTFRLIMYDCEGIKRYNSIVSLVSYAALFSRFSQNPLLFFQIDLTGVIYKKYTCFTIFSCTSKHFVVKKPFLGYDPNVVDGYKNLIIQFLITIHMTSRKVLYSQSCLEVWKKVWFSILFYLLLNHNLAVVHC